MPIRFTNKADLHEAVKLLDEIDNDPMHPVNDARHPEHAASLQAYQALQHGCEDQQLLIEQHQRAINRGY